MAILEYLFPTLLTNIGAGRMVSLSSLSLSGGEVRRFFEERGREREREKRERERKEEREGERQKEIFSIVRL